MAITVLTPTKFTPHLDDDWRPTEEQIARWLKDTSPEGNWGTNGHTFSDLTPAQRTQYQDWKARPENASRGFAAFVAEMRE